MLLTGVSSYFYENTSSGGGGGVAPTDFAVANNSSNGDANSISATGSVTIGRLMTVHFAAYESILFGDYTVSSYSQTGGTAVIGALSMDAATSRAGTLVSSVLYSQILSAPVISSGTITMTQNNGGGNPATFLWLTIRESSNTNTSASRVAASTASTGTGTSASPGTVGTGGAGIIYSILNPGPPFGTQTMDVPANYTLINESEDDSQLNHSYVFRSTATSITDGPTWTISTSSSWNSVAVAYKSTTP